MHESKPASSFTHRGCLKVKWHFYIHTMFSHSPRVWVTLSKYKAHFGQPRSGGKEEDVWEDRAAGEKGGGRRDMEH